MASRLLTALAGAALIAAPTSVLAQAAPAPATETVSSEASNLRGGGMALAGIYFSVLILLIVFQDDIFGEDGELGGPTIPTTP